MCNYSEPCKSVMNDHLWSETNRFIWRSNPMSKRKALKRRFCEWGLNSYVYVLEKCDCSAYVNQESPSDSCNVYALACTILSCCISRPIFPKTKVYNKKRKEMEGNMKFTVQSFQKAKEEGRKLTMLTAYDYCTAKLVDDAEIDSILVGDSLGNVMLGLGDTIPVTMEDMIHHGAAVVRGVKNAMVIMDMPFMSYETSVYDAVKNAGRLIKETHANAVKLEGGVKVAPQIKAIVDAGIPVCAHIGMTPQSINAFGGFKVQAKSEESARQLIEDAYAVQEAGAFAVVIECVPAKLGEYVSKKLSIPTIGIGAGNGCDGQVLVYQDMLGMFTDFTPKFAKRFAEVGEMMKQAFACYKEEVQSGVFPAEEHNYALDESILKSVIDE